MLLVTGVAIAPIPLTLTQAAPHPGRRAPSPSRQSLWDKFLSLFKPRVRHVGTRGPICTITPGLGHRQTNLWSDRPLFVWQKRAEVTRIQVRLKNSGTVAWNYPVAASQPSETTMSVTYNGEALRPGQTYELIFLDQDRTLIKDEDFNPQFTLLDAGERYKITQALIVKENQLRSQKATEEEITLEKAIYLCEQQLWSDAFQVIYAAKEQSPRLRTSFQDFSAEVCGQ